MTKLKHDSAQRLLDGVCYLTGHRIFPQKDVCERCRRSIVYYSVSLNNVYMKTEVTIPTTTRMLINLNVCRGDTIEVTALTRKGLKYEKFYKKIKVRKSRRVLSFKFK